ncbi:MAG TPA: ATP-binding protein [Bryobacteraceae bacterium]|nr:ATP-binding protein [Bryobacteraceae bacterium]
MAPHFSSPTNRLLIGLAVTLAAVCVFSAYTLRQLSGLKDLQTQIIDRNRKDSLQLLRIQNDLNSLGLTMRDMLDNTEPYPLTAFRPQFARTRERLDDALRLEAQYTPIGRSSGRQQYVSGALTQFWTSVDQLFAVAGHDPAAARDIIRNTLQAQQAALTNTLARLLVENNEMEEQATARVQEIYDRTGSHIYLMLAAVIGTIAITTLYLIRANRRVFMSLQELSEHRSELARRLIAVQEEVLHSISRELHDEFGQILTAMGAMLRRSKKRLPPDSPLHQELDEIRSIAQSTLEKVRSLSQMLHPTILDDGGLEKAIDWYIPLFQRQTGITVTYDKRGVSPVVPDRVAINVYRVLQEALNNLAKHSQTNQAWVRVTFAPDRLQLEVEDHGVGLPDQNSHAARGTGLIAMRERAESLHGNIDYLKPAGERGMLVRLEIPLTEAAAYAG